MLASAAGSETDVIVVGGGHAGAEAAHAAARVGARVLLLTQAVDRIGAMSCNPAIGGVGKGPIVRETDALGGLMARAADATGIQFRRLNASKGPAVRATRCQSDKARYANWIRQTLEACPGVSIKQDTVDDLLIEEGRVVGVVTGLGWVWRAKAIVLTTGTFLGGLLHYGERQVAGGRAGDAAATGLIASFERMGLECGRLKTGTVPRLDARTLDLAGLEEQPGDDPPPLFSFGSTGVSLPQRVCWLTETTPRTHQIIRDNLHRSPMYSGQIQSRGPRYCPSIEDKIVRFEAKESHRIFLEPEGLDTHEVYPNGISTSLPLDVQVALVRSIPGCANAEIVRPGYAVEYTFVDPRQLRRTLELIDWPGLYLAGQINGTTGYEDAAGQGLVAGANAGLTALGASSRLIPARTTSYLGVMVDDLVTRGVTEPYRMFTSRAEYRLVLREDNADQRLSPEARALGLLSDVEWAAFESREARRDALAQALEARLVPTAETQQRLGDLGIAPIAVSVTLAELARRPEVEPEQLAALLEHHEVSLGLLETLMISARYDGYIQRQNAQLARQTALEDTPIPADFDYAGIGALSFEARQRLARVRPETVGQAGRVEGITPAAVSVLLVWLRAGEVISSRSSAAG